MKIKISKTKWEEMGRKAGWMKKKLSPQKTQLVETEKQWSVSFPMMNGPVPLITGYGATAESAVQDLKNKAQADELGKIWFDSIDWDSWK